MSSDPPPLRPLAHPVGVLYEVRWNEIFPWLILVKALRVTLLVRVLVLAFLGVFAAQWGASLIDGAFTADATTMVPLGGMDVVELIPSDTDHPTLAQPISSPLVRGWQWPTQPFVQLASREISLSGSLALVAQGFWMIAVWSLFGGAIARITAQYLTRGETVGPLVSVKDALTIWPSTAGAPIIALLAAMALAVPLVVLGFLLRMNLLAVVAGLLWCFVLAWGVMLAVVLLGLLLGWPLMWACLGVERSDAFDGVSRCYAYVYQRPLQLLFYVAVAAMLALLGEVVVNFFVTAAISISEWGLTWGTGSETAQRLFADSDPGTIPLAARAIAGWKWVLTSLTEAYPLACLWAFAVGIYLLMRRHVDSTELDEITLSDGTLQAGLTKLKAKSSEASEVEAPSNGEAAQPDSE